MTPLPLTILLVTLPLTPGPDTYEKFYLLCVPIMFWAFCTSDSSFFLICFENNVFRPSVYGSLERTMIIARCFWALINFMITYLLVYVIVLCWHLICLWCFALIHTLHLAKLLLYVFLFIHHCSVTWSAIESLLILLEFCFDLLRGSCPSPFFYFFLFFLNDLVSNPHPLGGTMLLAPTKG